MSPCAAQTFENITADKWLNLKAKAAQNKIDLTGDSGRKSQQGFTFAWQYNAVSETLTIQCLEHPIWVSCGTVNGKVHDIISTA